VVLTPSGAQAGPPRLPAVDRVLAWPALAELAALHGRVLVRDAARAELAACRAAHRAGHHTGAALPAQAQLQTAISARVVAQLQPRLRPLFNLSGTVLHTNLGRAPLPPQALAAIAAVSSGACNLEYDLAAGQRGERDDAVAGLLQQLTGAAAATVVNNTAAALLLVLAALASRPGRREVIVSRGELIEIGGAFRLPDIMRQAGCTLREVGTTNRTHLRDHASAIGQRTALLLKVHASNYAITGFSAAPDEAELGALGREHGLPFVVDLGSGALLDLARFGLPKEPTPADTLARGADLVLFSGDKLLGGPQAGIVVGRADLIAKLKAHPLKRALRCDKLTLAALEAVLRLYLDPDRLAAQLPALRLLTRPAADIAAQAQQLAPLLRQWIATSPDAVPATAGAGAAPGRSAAAANWQVDVLAVHSQIGSGALPVDLLPSHALRLRPPGPQRGAGRQLDALAARLRGLPLPVLGRIADGALLLDLRCLDDEAGFVAQLGAAPPPPAGA